MAAAAAAAPAPAAETDAVALLVAHPAVARDADLVCRLLCTSRRLRAAVAARCGGQVALRFGAYELARLQRLVPWLGRHGALLRSLQLDLNLCGKEWAEAEAAVASALQRANASGTQYGLQLCSFRAYPACGSTVLQYLPAFYMKSLSLGPRADFSCMFAIEALTGLTRLDLSGDSADMLAPAAGALQRLARLSLHDVAPPTLKKLRSLPAARLAELRLSLACIRRSAAPPPPLELSHLTALTLLSSEGRPLVLHEGDALPAGIEDLSVRDVRSASPLLPLRRLRRLAVSHSTTAAGELRRVAEGLPELSDVSLGYAEVQDATAAAPAWSALPLRSLDFRAVEGCMPSCTLNELSKLSLLTQLEVHGGLGCCRDAGRFEATPQQFAAVLGSMTGLQELGLRGFELMPEGGGGCGSCGSAASSVASLASASSNASDSGGSSDAAGAASEGSSEGAAGGGGGGGMALVMGAISGLPHLASLTFCACSVQAPGDAAAAAGASPRPGARCIDREAAERLAAATQITSLSLCDCGLEDESVNTIAAGLTRLRRLQISSNQGVTGEVLPPPIARGLSQLSELCVLRTGIRRDAEGFRDRLVSLHPHLTVRSSAR